MNNHVENDNNKDSEKPFNLHFHLFIANNDNDSVIAKDNLDYISRTYLSDQFHIQIIDVTKDFQAALTNKIYVTPTLIVKTKDESLTIVGNLSDTKKLLDMIIPAIHKMKQEGPPS